MNIKFCEQLIVPLRQSSALRLIAIIETAKLTSTARTTLFDRHGNCAAPLLQQSEFSNLREIGPWLCSNPGATLHGAFDLAQMIPPAVGDALCGWIISRLPPEELAAHLSLANRAIAPDGHGYLLRYHTPHSITTLHARQDLPTVADWFAPIHEWWVPAANPAREEWRCLTGPDRLPVGQVAPLELDQACWDSLVGDPLAFRLADLLQDTLAGAGLPRLCHASRLALAQHHLAEGRELGLANQGQLAEYVTLMTLHGDAFAATPGWEQAMTQVRERTRTFENALQTFNTHIFR